MTTLPHITLDQKQIDVLLYSSNGFTVKQIAHKKGIGIRKVEWIKRTIMKELKAGTWPQAISEAFRLNIIN